MKNNHLKIGLGNFSRKISSLRMLTIIPFVFFIGANLLDIRQINLEIKDTSKIITKEQFKIEANLDRLLIAGEYCGMASRRNHYSQINSLKNVFQVMNDISFTIDEKWKSNVKLLSKVINKDYYNYSDKDAFHTHRNLIARSENTPFLKEYTTAKLNEEVALRIYRYCTPHGSRGCGASYIKPTVKQKGDDYQLFNYAVDYTASRSTYSINGSGYENHYTFLPTQSGTHFLDVKERYVQGFEIKTQTHCVEVVVE